MRRVRVMRVLIYEGDEDWVEKTLKTSLPNGTRRCCAENYITARTIEEFPEVLAQHESREPVVKHPSELEATK